MNLTKKRLVATLGAVCVSSSIITYGATKLVTKIQAEMRNDYTIMVQSEKLDTKGQGAISYNNTTYLPVRLISEAVGQQVSWDKNTKTINIGSEDVKQEPTTLLDLKSTIHYSMSLSKNIEYIADGDYALHMSNINSASKDSDFELGKKYNTFSGRAINTSQEGIKLTISDENDISLYEEVIEAGEENSITVDISGVSKLNIAVVGTPGGNGTMNIIDATVY